jgi:DNA-binding HxlR family transcriptional regulator
MNLTMNKYETTDCGITKALETIGGKWTMLILRDLMTGPKRFGELEHSLSGISTRTLAQRLEELANDDIVVRDCSEGPTHPLYCLTSKGASLQDILDQLRMWGNQLAVK